MKKTALTFVAIALGMGVSFAQTAPQTEDATTTTEQSVTMDKMSAKPEEAGRRAMKVEELPAAVQEQLKSEEFAALTVVTVTEVQPQADAQASGVQYEVALQDGAAEAAAEPSLVVLFDENGQLISRTEAAAAKDEE